MDGIREFFVSKLTLQLNQENLRALYVSVVKSTH